MKRVSLIAALAGVSLTLMGSAPLRRASALIDDATILARFEEMVSADVSCAQLAVERGHSKEMKDFAGVLVREHGMARQMARDVAMQLHITLKSSSDGPRAAEHEKVLKELRNRPDIAFDVLFARHEIEYHKELVALIDKEWLPAAKDADLSAMLAQVGPAFAAHQKMAEDLAKQLAPK